MNEYLTPEQIKLLRKTLNRTQIEMAALIGLHPITWHRWEVGENIPGKRDMAVLVRWYKQYVVAQPRNGEVVG